MRFSCAGLALLVFVSPALAQGVPRIKAKVIAFNGETLTVAGGPEDAKTDKNGKTGKDAQNLAVGIQPTTRILREEAKTVSDIKTGDYLGATVVKTKSANGEIAWRAQEAHLFPEVLRGSGEGLYEIGGGRTMAAGGVTAVSANDKSIALTLHYRGADGRDGPTCTGRAIPPAGKTALQPGCAGDAQLLLAPNVPVIALVPADKSQLVPGAVVTLSLLAGPDGRPVTPGLTINSSPIASSPGATPK